MPVRMLSVMIRRSVLHLSRLHHWKRNGVLAVCRDNLRSTVDTTGSHRMFKTASTSQKNLKVIRRDQHRRKCVAEYEADRLRLRAIVKNKLLPEVVQQKARKELASQPRNASITRVRNRCVLTGRGRGVIGEYGLSRMKFRKLADFGLLSGVTRSTW